MGLTTSVIMILVFVIIYDILIQVYTVLFRITGLTKEKAKFQSISLLTNCGFTTTESEIITNDRVRRRIAVAAMITGYAFSVIIVSLIINTILSFKDEQLADSVMFIATAFAIFLLFVMFTKIPFVKKLFESFIQWICKFLFKRSHNENVILLLDQYGKDAIAEVYLNKVPDFLVDKTVLESKLKDKYRINVLMFKRNGKTMDVTKDTIFKQKDSLVVFGSYAGIRNCFKKKKNETKKNIIELIEEYGDEAMAEVQINRMPEFLKNKGLFESGLKSTYNLNLLTIKRKDEIVPITKDTILELRDIIVLFGPYVRIREIFADNDLNIEDEA